MYIIVVGAGPVGEYLLRLSLEGGHDVALIESGDKRAEHCAQQYDARVLHAEIGEEGILDEAGADQADALIATTDDDSINLMAMVLGQEYEIENLISIVNSRHRKALFDRLKVNTLVDPEILAARHLLDLVLHPGGENVTSLTGYGQIYELELADDSALVDRRLDELHEENAVPEGSFIVLVQRGDKQIFPREDVQLRAGDVVLVFCARPLTRKQLGVFVGEN